MIVPFRPAVTRSPRLAGERLRQARTARGLTVAELARASGMGADRLSAAEADAAHLNGAEVHALISSLHLPLDYLFRPAASLALHRLRPLRRGGDAPLRPDAADRKVDIP